MVVITLQRFFDIMEGKYSGIALRIKEKIEKARELESLVFQLREYLGDINLKDIDLKVIRKEFEKSKDAVIETIYNNVSKVTMIIDNFSKIRFYDKELQEFYESTMRKLEKIDDPFEYSAVYIEFIKALKQKMEEKLKESGKIVAEIVLNGVILEEIQDSVEIKYQYGCTIEIVP